MPRRRPSAPSRPAAAAAQTVAAAPPADTLLLSPRAVRAILAALVTAFIILATLYAIATPAATAEQHNPDESAHMLSVQTLASGHLPVFSAGGANYEAHQPPLYYLLCAPVYTLARGAGPAATVRAVRGVSVVLGALLILAAFGCVRALLPEQPLYALGTAAFIALLPMNASLCGSVTNDALTNLLIALALWRLALMPQHAGQGTLVPRQQWREAVLLTVLVGAGIWTKTSTLLLVPTVVAACYGLARRGLMTAREATQVALVAAGGGVLLGAPWLVRNQLLYGDPLAQHLFETAFRSTAQAPDLIRYIFGGSIGAYLMGVAQWTFASFWGVFDSMRLFWGRSAGGPPPSPAQALPTIYTVIAVVCVACVAGLALWLRRAPKPSAAQGVILGTFGLLVGLTWLAHLRFILVFFQAQGRYWFPALVPLALGFVLGLRGLAPRPAVFAALLVLMTIGLLALNIDTLAVLLPARFGQGAR